jgi:two-component system nitrate/nitrite response regulator NarL
MTVTVFVAEDHPVFRKGLTDVLSESHGIELVGEADTGTEALKRLRELEPQIALLDLKLPGIDGIDVLRQLGKDSPTRVVLLSMHVDAAIVFEAVNAGAIGYLSKDSAVAEIPHAVLAAAEGRRVLSPGLDEKLLDQIANRSRGAELSGREREIVRLLAEGLTRADIASRLHLGEGTVKTYIARAYEKLGVTSRAAAVAEAMRRGIAG